MNSLQLIRRLHADGTLSKEASIRVMKKRDALIKKAMVQLTEELFFEKGASFWGWGKGKETEAVVESLKSVPPKGASLRASIKNIGPLLGLAGLVALGTTAAKMGLGSLADIKMKSELDASYNTMFKEIPELSEDKVRATKFFNMMSKFAPALAANPIIAGTWVRGTMNSNVVAPSNISALIDAQSKWEEVRSMKSPIVGLRQELPKAETIFGKALMGGMATG